MDVSNAVDMVPDADARADKRQARRYVSLIRAAKLLTARGEFVCVIRDVSSAGISLRSFHMIPPEGPFMLELRNGHCFELDRVRGAACEASYRFAEPVRVSELISESWSYPRRQLRLAMAMPMALVTLCGRFQAVSENLSQQGARVACAAALAIDQPLRIETPSLPPIRAKVRWRSDGHYGLIFDDTFSLRDFALLAAAVQAPALLRPTPA